MGEEFPIEKGVRQGDPVSSKLFSAALEMIFRNLDWNKNGLNINDENLNHLRFADDLILFAECPIKLEQMLQQLSNQSIIARLSMNTSKTKIMTNASHSYNIKDICCERKNEKWTRIISEWYPRDGKKNKGRPIKRWEDDIKGVAGPEWTRIARDRDRWKSLEKAFVERQGILYL
ncbi:Retrovirus-related Pol polyprotein from type-2 retrotransposable element R2DM; Endonuclease [Eumeta japonica]|uniref:Retrovirus-related Pol polyprotein from type-2 retrotransposable element R2DM Endonuclease n=1 Tax=Eumeta variegata TaxID=151549 RepID=A0A4C1ZJ76_EUMVA|nr:Retrovirus-related Pol polyprotein from type-2 retrotransposable element R2DM; Endonuclease [Eumeta japonica]